MRKVIATKDAAHTREKMSMVTFFLAPPNSRWRPFRSIAALPRFCSKSLVPTIGEE
jgi:hypothetical protein